MFSPEDGNSALDYTDLHCRRPQSLAIQMACIENDILTVQGHYTYNKEKDINCIGLVIIKHQS